MSERNQTVTIQVKEDAGVARKLARITLGVPFSPRQLADANALRLAAPDDSAVPLQARAACTYADGSLQWARLDFQTDLAGQEEKTFCLSVAPDAPQPKPQQSVSVTETDRGLDVDNGRLRFSVRTSPFSPLCDLALDGKAVAPQASALELFATDAAGNRFTSTLTSDVEIEVEEPGPIVAVIRCTGRHRDEAGKPTSPKSLRRLNKHLTFMLRITVAAGHADLTLAHTFINTNPGRTTGIGSVGLTVQMAGAESGTIANHPSDSLHVGSLRQEKPSEYFLSTDGGPEEKQTPRAFTIFAGNPAGWAALRSNNHSLLVVVEKFWQNYPKKLEIAAPGLSVHLWPREQGVLTAAQGLAKTHRVHLAFCRGEPAECARIAKGCFDPPSVLMAPEVYDRALLFQGMLPYSPKLYPNLEIILRESFWYAWRDRHEMLPKNKEYPTQRLFGMLDFGDYTREGRLYRQNGEHDLPHALALQYVRTGERCYYDAFLDVAQHMMDVDICHCADDPIAPNGAHKPGGLYYHRTHNDPDGDMTLCHQWLEGFLEVYFLTGDRRGLEIARGVGDNLLEQIKLGHHRQRGYMRVQGWSLLALVAIHQATGDSRYLAGCKALIEHLRAWQNDRGLFMRDWSGFKAVGSLDGGVLMTALSRHHRMTGDDEDARFFLKSLDGLIDELLSPEGVFNASSLRDSRRPGLEQSLFLEPLAYAHRLTGDERYLRIGVSVFRYVMFRWVHYEQMVDVLRMTTVYRSIFRFMKAAHDAGLLEDLRLM